MLLWLLSTSSMPLVEEFLLCGVGGPEWLMLLEASCACVHSDTSDVSGVIAFGQKLATD